MGMEIMGNYSNYAAQNMTGDISDNSKKADSVEKTKSEPVSKGTKSKSTGNKNTQNSVNYMSSLEKLAPSVKFGTDTSLSSARSGKTLNLNPKLLEKMQNDPNMEKDMKDMIAGIETAMNISESVNKSLGMKTVYSHWYIDENGKCWHTGYYVSDDTMSKKLREERNKNSEKLIEKRREKAAELRKKRQEKLKEKKTEKADSEKLENTSDKSRAEKIEYDLGKDGNADNAVQEPVGANVDIKT